MIFRTLKYSFGVGLVAIFILLGWAEYRVQEYLRSGGRSHSLRVTGLTGPVKNKKYTTLKISSGALSKKQRPIALSEAPLHLKQAILTVEDRRFYDHIGIDPKALTRALYLNLSQGRVVQGGSTLTQQLAKNIFLTAERTVVRKILEVAIALVLELHLTKDEILELYLNEVYLGQEGNVALHGVGSAARSFFQKGVPDLSVGEASLLAGIIRAPSTYSPKRHPKRARERRDLVLQQLRNRGHISESVLHSMKNEPIEIAATRPEKRFAPFFSIALNKSVERDTHFQSLPKSGTTIVTGLSLELQQCAEDAITQGLDRLEKQFPFLASRSQDGRLEAGLVALDPLTGLVRAWVGGRDYRGNQFDHVSLAKRQIGSTIKPFIYLTALDPKLNSYKTGTLRTILPDKPISVPLPNGETWSPSNADERYRGRVTFRYALEQSLNLPPIHIVRRFGIDTLRSTIERFRLHPDPPAVLALSLGALETSLLSLTSAFSALANQGIYVRPRLFNHIEGSEGEILYRHPFVEERVAGSGPTFLVNDALRGVIERGTAQRAKLFNRNTFPSGKTGTSQDGRDAWFVGYTPNIAAGVWVGFDDNRPVRVSGGHAAAPIWKRFMDCGERLLSFPRPTTPPEVKSYRIDLNTGLLATPHCPRRDVVSEFYLDGTGPTRSCTAHGRSGSKRSESYSDDYRDGGRYPPPPKKRRRSIFDGLFGL